MSLVVSDRAGVSAVRGGQASAGSILMLDPGLFFEGGHHATLARLVCAEARGRGMGVRIHGARRIDHPPAGIEIQNLFRVSSYAPLNRWAPGEVLDELNAGVLEDLRSLPAGELRGCGVMFFPTITSRIALGVARWLRELRDDAPPAAMFLMFPPGWSGQGEVARAELELYRRAIAEINAIPGHRVTLFAETEPIAEVFRRLGAARIHMLPWPVMLAEPRDRALPFRAGSMPVHVAHLGYTKQNRGIQLLADVVPQMLGRHPGLTFAIQANYWDQTGVHAPAMALGSMGPRVRVLRGALAPERYAEHLSEADIVALPYNAAHYRTLGSGVFAEAAALGKALVLPDQTWLAEQARVWDLGATFFDRYESESFGVALDEAIRRRDELLDRAERARESWAQHRSPARFLDGILEAVREAASAPVTPVAVSARVEGVGGRGPGVTAPETDNDFLVDGYWTPQTQMLRSIRDWLILASDTPVRALSIGRNPVLRSMVSRRWPGLEITEARWPEFDAQDLHQIADGTYDLVYSDQVLEHVPKPWKAAAELVRVMRPGGLAVHTTCAANPRHGPPLFNDYYRFLPDGLEQLFDTDAGRVEIAVKASWGNRQALLYNHAIDDGHGVLGGRRFVRAIGEPNEENFPWATWIIFRKL